MTTLTIADARSHLADAINKVVYAGERISFVRRGKPVAALVSVDDLATLQRIEDDEDMRDAVRAIKEYDANPKIAENYTVFRRKQGLGK